MAMDAENPLTNANGGLPDRGRAKRQKGGHPPPAYTPALGRASAHTAPANSTRAPRSEGISSPTSSSFRLAATATRPARSDAGLKNCGPSHPKRRLTTDGGRHQR